MSEPLQGDADAVALMARYRRRQQTRATLIARYELELDRIVTRRGEAIANIDTDLTFIETQLQGWAENQRRIEAAEGVAEAKLSKSWDLVHGSLKSRAQPGRVTADASQDPDPLFALTTTPAPRVKLDAKSVESAIKNGDVEVDEDGSLWHVRTPDPVTGELGVRERVLGAAFVAPARKYSVDTA